MAVSKLNKQQREFVKEMVRTGNGAEAAVRSYNVSTRNSGAAIATRNLKKPQIVKEIERLQQAMADRISDELLEEKHLALLNKEEVLIQKDKDGEVEIISTGQIDANAVAKGLDMGYKLKGYYAPEKKVVANINAHVFNPKIQEINEKYNAEVFEALKDNS